MEGRGFTLFGWTPHTTSSPLRVMNQRKLIPPKHNPFNQKGKRQVFSYYSEGILFAIIKERMRQLSRGGGGGVFWEGVIRCCSLRFFCSSYGALIVVGLDFFCVERPGVEKIGGTGTSQEEGGEDSKEEVENNLENEMRTRKKEEGECRGGGGGGVGWGKGSWVGGELWQKKW